MKKKNKLKRLSRWGIPLTLATFCLMNHQNEITVQANHYRSSNIGTFEGETTFSLSSETGVLPSIEIETKDVYGNTNQYQSEGGNLVIPNTEEGSSIKSAILTGQTLVNLLDKTTVNVGANQENTHISINMTTTPKKGKYIMLYNVKIPTSSYIITLGRCTPRIDLYDGTSLYHGYEDFNTTKGVKKWIFTANSDIDRVRFWTNGNAEPILVEDFILLEYQEGMENWDIPYFEGIQSVKAPVLTVSNEDDSKTAEITLEEDLVLRSNGNVYDELDLVTGKFTQRLDENNNILDQEIIRYVKINSTHSFNQPQEGDISVKGTITPTLGSITVPTETLTFNLNPNLESSQQFIAPDFSISNDSLSPIGLELKSFEQVTNVLNDVLPDKYDSWEGLNKKQSQDIALALIPQPSDRWISLNEGSYYVANTSNAKLGQIKGNSTVDLKFSALHGQAFSEPLSPQYKLTFVFEL